MAIVAMFEVNGASASKYDEVIRRLTEIGERVPDGQMYHICYGDKQRLQVIDVYENQAQARRLRREAHADSSGVGHRSEAHDLRGL